MTTTTDYSTLHLADLKRLLQERGLTVSGRKSQLIERLESHDLASLAHDLAVPSNVESEVTEKGGTIVEYAQSFSVTSDEQYESAGEFLTREVNSALRQLDDAFDPIIRRWHEGHRETIATKKGLAAPFETAKRIISKSMADWIDEKERRDRERQKRLDIEAQERAEQAAVERAAALLEEGREEEAQRVLTQLAGGEIEPASPPPMIVPKRPKAAGTSVRRQPDFEIVDVGAVKRAYLQPNETLIRQVVRRLGEGAEKEVGGIKVTFETKIGSGVRD